jgi:predicted metal-dependent phosphoesterase TrpH
VKLSPGDGVDLHLHTTVHDGRWTPDGLVRHAAAHGIRCLAVTDHDMTAGIAPARAAAGALGLVVIPAVEVTTLWRGSEYHVLVYGGRLDPPAAPLAGLLEQIHRRQLERARQWLASLARRGLALPSLAAVRRGRELMPIYVAGAVIRDGHVPDYAACVRLLRTLECDVEPAAPLEQVAAAAHAVGAVALIAHPGRNENGFAALWQDDLEAMVQEGPLDGVEVYHPNHPPRLQQYYLEFARQRQLLVSAGSDSHGPAYARVPAAHPARLCWDLLERCWPATGASAALTADIARALRASSGPGTGD